MRRSKWSCYSFSFLPSSGNYFASHFFMGGEKFDTPHPEGYLFGENMDLNFLGNRPVQVRTDALSSGLFYQPRVSALHLLHSATFSFFLLSAPVSVCDTCTPRACENPEEPGQHQKGLFAIGQVNIVRSSTYRTSRSWHPLPSVLTKTLKKTPVYRYKDDSDAPVEEGGKPKVQYGVEFTFDADARVAITLYCQAFEEFSNGMAV